MSSSLPRKVLVWPHPDSLNHVTWSTDLRLQPLLWASYTTPITVHDSPLNAVYGRKEKEMEATCLKIWLILFVSNLSERACLWRECFLKELRLIYCPRFKHCFLASVSSQTWIHHFTCVTFPKERCSSKQNTGLHTGYVYTHTGNQVEAGKQRTCSLV